MLLCAVVRRGSAVVVVAAVRRGSAVVVVVVVRRGSAVVVVVVRRGSAVSPLVAVVRRGSAVVVVLVVVSPLVVDPMLLLLSRFLLLLSIPSVTSTRLV